MTNNIDIKILEEAIKKASERLTDATGITHVFVAFFPDGTHIISGNHCPSCTADTLIEFASRSGNVCHCHEKVKMDS